MLLQVVDLHVYYDSIHALQGVSMDVDRGEVVTLIGANGAGKSTTLRAISRLIPTRSGRILLDGQDLLGMPAHAVAEHGISHVPEGRRVFPQMTVRENLLLGAYTRFQKARVDRALETVYGHFPVLRERRGQLAGTLSGGEQQMLAMGRGLMSEPRILLLDEPSMGLAPILVEQIYQIIREISREGATILLVEQNAHMALSVAQRGYVLETGRIVLAGRAKDLAANQAVQEAYLGGAAGS
jgi:branched-chain amino acid transport system ATP-binding protein